MKACIICPDERNYLPQIEKYTEFFKKNSVDYDIIFNCHDSPSDDTPPANEFTLYEKTDNNLFSRLKNFQHYRKFIVEILEQKEYDRLVILGTIPAMLIRKYLHNEYKERYILDYRGCTFEQEIPFYKLFVDKIIDNSFFTAISSHGFMDFLSGNKKIIVNHNLPFDINATEPQDINGKSVINIGFIGKINYYDENCELISMLKNEFKYQLWYLGKDENESSLEIYCQTNGITNVSFVGKYINSQKSELYKNMDIVNAVFGDDTIGKRTLLPTRLYDACLLKKPIIASKNTFLGEVIERYNLGLTIDTDEENTLSELNNYIEKFDLEEFNTGCIEFLSDVKTDEDCLNSALRQFIKKRKKR